MSVTWKEFRDAVDAKFDEVGFEPSEFEISYIDFGEIYDIGYLNMSYDVVHKTIIITDQE